MPVPVEGTISGSVDRRGWSSRLREVPAGVLVLAALLAFLAGGTLFGGAYLLFTRTQVGGLGWAMILVAAPLSLYMAVQLVRRTRWAWRTTVIMVALLLLSSIARALLAPRFPAAALGEVALEVIVLIYLALPRVRASFGT